MKFNEIVMEVFFPLQFDDPNSRVIKFLAARRALLHRFSMVGRDSEKKKITTSCGIEPRVRFSSLNSFGRFFQALSLPPSHVILEDADAAGKSVGDEKL